MFKEKEKKQQRINRSSSIANNSQRATIAEFNKVSIRTTEPTYKLNKPLRIIIPQFFNVPIFIDKQLIFQVVSKKTDKEIQEQSNFEYKNPTMDVLLKKRVKDLSILAEGMKRSKNIKQESRYYFIQGVMLHNAGFHDKAIELFDKFLKIVLFIKDEKSVQLALNAIGCCYMQSKQFQKAIQYHAKQATIMSNADEFIGRINVGMCHQLANRYNDAHREYEQALNFEKRNKKNQKRMKYAQQLIQRCQEFVLAGDMFLTQKQSEKLKESNLLRNSSVSQQKIKRMYLGKMQKSPNRKQYEKAKVGYAVSKAQQSIGSYIESMRQSLSLQKSKFKTEQNEKQT